MINPVKCTKCKACLRLGCPAIYIRNGDVIIVKMTEVHGMAQRGGSVTTQIRFGDKVYSPLMETGTAHVLLAFEKLEAARFLHYLSEEGTLIVNDAEIPPVTTLMGQETYPQDLMQKLVRQVKSMVPVDAADIAQKCGNVLTQNMVLVGVLAKVLNLEERYFMEAIEETVPEKYVKVNMESFRKGYKLSYRKVHINLL